MSASNVTHWSELPINTHHDTFYNDDWNKKYNEANFQAYEEVVPLGGLEIGGQKRRANTL